MRFSCRPLRIGIWPFVFLWASILALHHVAWAQDEANNAGQTVPENTAEAHMGAGYENLRNNRYEAAVREFRAALDLNPKLVLQARFPLAVSLFELHKNDEARREFGAVQKEVGEHPNVEYYLGRLDLTDGKVDSAIEELEKAAVKPPFPDTAYHLGSAYLKKHDLPQAEKWLLKAAELTPNDSAVQYRLSLLYAEQGRKEEAQQARERSEQLRQRDTEVDRVRLECSQKLDQGSLDVARVVCEQLDDPEDADKLTMLGTIYGQHGAFEDALRPLRRAAELKPNSPQMQYNLAFDLAQLGRFEEARAPLAQALERWPDLFPLNALYGAVLFNLGKARPAYEALRHAHELNPEDQGTTQFLYQVTLSLAQQTFEGKAYAETQRYLAEAIKLRPEEPDPHHLLAQVYDATGKHDEADQERRKEEKLKNSNKTKAN